MTGAMTDTAVRDDLVAVLRDFAAHQVTPRAAALDAADQAPGVLAEMWRQLAGLDLDRALLAEERGGVGLEVGDFLCVLDELAAADAGVALTVLLHNAALQALPAELAVGLADGARWSLAFAPAGADRGVELSGGRVRGSLGAVFGAVGADGVVVAAGTPRPAVFAVRAGDPGLTVRSDPAPLGLRAARCAELAFDDAAAVAAAGAAEAADMLSSTRALVYCGIAAICHGIARRAHQVALDYAHNRIQGGKPIVEHGAVSDMLAKMAVRLHTGTTARLAMAVDDPAAALAHKIAASDAAMATTLDAVQVMGGIGYMIDTGVEKLMRDAKYCQLYPEANWLARDELLRLDRSACQTPVVS